MHKPYEPDPLRVGDRVIYARKNAIGTITEFREDGGITVRFETDFATVKYATVKYERCGGLFNGALFVKIHRRT